MAIVKRSKWWLQLYQKDSVASLLAATLYQGNLDRNHKLWNIILNNSRFGDFVDRIYPIELEIKDTTDTDRSASYLYLHLEIDSEGR
jgi:hypothetical protein